MPAPYVWDFSRFVFVTSLSRLDLCWYFPVLPKPSCRTPCSRFLIRSMWPIPSSRSLQLATSGLNVQRVRAEQCRNRFTVPEAKMIFISQSSFDRNSGRCRSPIVCPPDTLSNKGSDINGTHLALSRFNPSRLIDRVGDLHRATPRTHQ